MSGSHEKLISNSYPNEVMLEVVNVDPGGVAGGQLVVVLLVDGSSVADPDPHFFGRPCPDSYQHYFFLLAGPDSPLHNRGKNVHFTSMNHVGKKMRF